MAIYHLSVKIIGRRAGRSAVAAAAYRSGELLTSNYDGCIYNYTRKHWIEHTNILLPPNAPAKYQDRNTLWNAVEDVEKAKNSQLAREIEIALPIELSLDEQIRLVEDYIRTCFVSEGMCADYAIHNPPIRNDRGQPIDSKGNVTSEENEMIFQNPHAHIMLTMRPMTSKGTWAKKSKITYICRRGNKEAEFTARGYRNASKEGWEKQYKYSYQGRRVWMTPSDAAKKHAVRLNKNPKTSRFGLQHSLVTRWNSKECELEWRKKWEKIANQYLEQYGSDARIDSRSYEEQGRDEIPTVHLGPSAINHERRIHRLGEESNYDLIQINNEIKKYNQLIQELNMRILEIDEEIESLKQKISDSIEVIREELQHQIMLRDDLELQIQSAEVKLQALNQTIRSVDALYQNTKKANVEAEDKIVQLNNELLKTGRFSIPRRRELLKQINHEKKMIDERNQMLWSAVGRYKLTSIEDILRLANESSEIEVEKQIQINQLAGCMDDIARLTQDYLNVMSIVFGVKVLDGIDNMEILSASKLSSLESEKESGRQHTRH